MNYNGQEVEEFISKEPVVFEPPIMALVWYEESFIMKRKVFIYDPRLPMPVIGLNNDGYINNEYCHMALIQTTKENTK